MTKKEEYYSKQLARTNADSKKYKALDTLLGNVTSSVFPKEPKDDIELANKFNAFFMDKVTKLISNMPPTSLSFVTINEQISFSSFHLVSANDIEKEIMSMTNSSCSIDVLPTFVVKKLAPILSPSLSLVFNKYLDEGLFPESFKEAIITPLLKKENLDKDDLLSYRPISNLQFLSKLMERLVHKL